MVDGGNGHLPHPLLEFKKRADFSDVPRIYRQEGHKGPRYFLVGDRGASGGGQRALAPSQKYKIAVYCCGVARSFGPQGHKWPRYVLLGDMGARGEQGALAPNPLWNIKTC